MGHALAKAKQNAWIARGHIAHAILGLFDRRNSFGSQLEGRERLYRPCMKVLNGNFGRPSDSWCLW